MLVPKLRAPDEAAGYAEVHAFCLSTYPCHVDIPENGSLLKGTAFPKMFFFVRSLHELLLLIQLHQDDVSRSPIVARKLDRSFV